MQNRIVAFVLFLTGSFYFTTSLAKEGITYGLVAYDTLDVGQGAAAGDSATTNELQNGMFTYEPL